MLEDRLELSGQETVQTPHSEEDDARHALRSVNLRAERFHINPKYIDAIGITRIPDDTEQQ